MKILSLALMMMLFSSCAVVTKNKMKNDIAKRLFDLFDRTTSGLSDNQIASVRDKRPELPKPFHMAVYFKQPQKKEDWRWTREDRDQLLASVATKKSVGRSFELINTSGNDEGLENLRLMAAQQGADALLVIQGVGEVQSDANGLAISYISRLCFLLTETT